MRVIAQDDGTYRLYGGEGHGCRGWTPGQVVSVKGTFLYVISSTRQYYREDGLSFGVGDDRGHMFAAVARRATDEESATLRAEREAQEHARNLEAHRTELATQIMAAGERPSGPVRPDGVRVSDRQTIYGGGDWFILGDVDVWYVRNNGADCDDWSHNNIQTGGAGAIGLRVPRTDTLTAAVQALRA